MNIYKHIHFQDTHKQSKQNIYFSLLASYYSEHLAQLATAMHKNRESKNLIQFVG